MTNKEAIVAFYGQALTVNSTTRPTAVLTPILAEEFLSSGSVASKNKEQLMGQLEFFWKLIPNLVWEPQEIINEGNKFVVRSIASGNPSGDFMGTPTDGTKAFKIMLYETDLRTDSLNISNYYY